MKTRLVKLGNSKGVRIPKRIIEQLALGDEVEVSARGDQLVIQASKRPRSGWGETVCMDGRPQRRSSAPTKKAVVLRDGTRPSGSGDEVSSPRCPAG